MIKYHGRLKMRQRFSTGILHEFELRPLVLNLSSVI